MEELKAELQTLHNRLERFNDWAECLQGEFRKIQGSIQTMDNRLQFIEGQCLGLAEFHPANEDVLWKRLEQLKR